MSDIAPLAVQLAADIRAGRRPMPTVAIGIPYYRTVEGPTLLACMDMAASSAVCMRVLPISCSGAYVEQNRNGIVDYALAVEKQAGFRFDYLMWIDTDMQFPKDVLFRLIAHDKDVVGANYRTRTAPFRHAGHYLDGTDRHVMDHGLVPMAHLPTGLLLTKFAIYRELPKPWFRAPRDETEPRDDVYFCNQARAAGYEIWCDQDLTRQVYHRTVQDLSWFQDEQIVVAGVELNIADEKVRGDERAALSAAQYGQGVRHG
jgi:hypothetical protein